MPVEYLTPPIEDRAVPTRGSTGQCPFPNLLVAATAELAGLTVLHVDMDYDLIAAVTHQRVQRLTHE